MSEVVGSFSLKMRPGFEGGPNVSTLLGSWNINTKKFKDDFELKTKGLPDYFVMKLTINILPTKEIEFNFANISLSHLFKLLTYQASLKKRGPGGFINIEVLAIQRKDFFKAIVYKFGSLTEANIRKAFGTLLSSLIVLKDKDMDIIVKGKKK